MTHTRIYRIQRSLDISSVCSYSICICHLYAVFNTLYTTCDENMYDFFCQQCLWSRILDSSVCVAVLYMCIFVNFA